MLAWCTIADSRAAASDGERRSSRMRRSSLLIIRQGVTFSSHACRSTACVWMHTPSTASTTTSAPSLSRAAVDTSLQKSTWPGESIRLTRYPEDAFSSSLTPRGPSGRCAAPGT